MNKIFNNLITLTKSLYGLIIYFAVSFIFNYILKNTSNIDAFTYNLLLISYEVITLLLLLLLYRKRLKKDFNDFDKNYKEYLSLGFKVWIIALLVMVCSNLIINNFITNNIAYNQNVNMAIIRKYPLYTLVSMIIAGPFIEELVFRLGFKNNIKNKKMYYVLSVLIFTSMHVLNGISSPQELLYFIPYGSLAIGLSYILDKTDNIFTTTIIHTLHNAFTVVLIAMYGIL